MPFAQINNQEIYFEDSAGPGPVLVMMHGFLMDQTLFDAQVQMLSPHYRCIRWDARAFGKTKWDGKPFTLYDSASDCIKLMDFLDVQSAVLVGMSQGGYCALRAALTYPERVQGVVLLSTCADLDPNVPDYEQMRDTWRNLGPVESLLEGVATMLLGPKENPRMQKHWDMCLPKWRKISGENIFHAVNNLLERDDIVPKLKQITCPAFVAHGDADHGMVIARAKAMSDALPNCKDFVSVPGAAHVANMTHSDVINPPLLAFLNSQKFI